MLKIAYIYVIIEKNWIYWYHIDKSMLIKRAIIKFAISIKCWGEAHMTIFIYSIYWYIMYYQNITVNFSDTCCLIERLTWFQKTTSNILIDLEEIQIPNIIVNLIFFTMENRFVEQLRNHYHFAYTEFGLYLTLFFC